MHTPVVSLVVDTLNIYTKETMGTRELESIFPGVGTICDQCLLENVKSVTLETPAAGDNDSEDQWTPDIGLWWHMVRGLGHSGDNTIKIKKILLMWTRNCPGMLILIKIGLLNIGKNCTELPKSCIFVCDWCSYSVYCSI